MTLMLHRDRWFSKLQRYASKGIQSWMRTRPLFKESSSRKKWPIDKVKRNHRKSSHGSYRHSSMPPRLPDDQPSLSAIIYAHSMPATCEQWVLTFLKSRL